MYGRGKSGSRSVLPRFGRPRLGNLSPSERWMTAVPPVSSPSLPGSHSGASHSLGGRCYWLVRCSRAKFIRPPRGAAPFAYARIRCVRDHYQNFTSTGSMSFTVPTMAPNAYITEGSPPRVQLEFKTSPASHTTLDAITQRQTRAFKRQQQPTSWQSPDLLASSRPPTPSTP